MSASKPKKEKSTSSPDELITDLDVKLTEQQQQAVKGGKAKTADKAYTQMDGYIKQ